MGSVPELFSDANLASIHDPELRERLETWDDPRMPLFYSPGYGNGKTYAAIAFARHIAETRGIPFRYVTAAGMFTRMRLSFGGGPAYVPPMNMSLILDDIGKQRVSEWVQEWLFVLIDDLWANGRPLIVTMNGQPRSLKDQIGGAAFDRLRSMTLPVKLEGESKR
jgi:DNA replication protein DnaC